MFANTAAKLVTAALGVPEAVNGDVPSTGEYPFRTIIQASAAAIVEGWYNALLPNNEDMI
jgi:hypothetical protein